VAVLPEAGEPGDTPAAAGAAAAAIAIEPANAARHVARRNFIGNVAERLSRKKFAI